MTAVGDGMSWLGSPVTTWTGYVHELSPRLPSFRRIPFAVGKSEAGPGGESPRYDAIVRLPTLDSRAETPVGVVSRNYRLVQHDEILQLAIKALEGVKIGLQTITADLMLTEHGERMALCLTLPERFDYVCPAGDPMRLRFDCFNSVDGSSRLAAFLGWHRFVCSNGMIVGTTLGQYRRAHNPGLDPEDLGRVLRDGMRLAVKERKRFDRWRNGNVDGERLKRWIDGELRDAWGVKAAARAYAIATTGHDAEFTHPFEGGRPTERRVKLGPAVPGSIVPASSPFAVSQVLSWLAGQRQELPERIEWTAQIPRLIETLVRAN